MIVRRVKKPKITLEMVEPGEVFETFGILQMKCRNEIDGCICAVSLADGYIQKYKHAEDYRVNVIHGEFVEKGPELPCSGNATELNKKNMDIWYKRKGADNEEEYDK